MALEIERKFLVRDDTWRRSATGSRRFVQFYLSQDGPSSVRIRIADRSDAWLTIKAAREGLAREEFEYRIPLADAEAMQALAEGAVIEKVRHIVPLDGHEWEVDVFEGDNRGLVVAEIELASETTELALPAWLGAEVTGERRYYNASLAQLPFSRWRP